MFFVILAGAAFVVTFVLPILAFQRATDAARRAAALEQRLRAMEERLDRWATATTGAPVATTTARRPASPPLAVVTPRAEAAAPASPAQPAAAAPPPRPAPAVAATPMAAAPAPASAASTLESEIGSRLMLVAGIVILVLGVGFFVKYAFDNSWISPTTRVAAATLAGAGAWFAGLSFSRRGYRMYGHMIAGGGLAMAYVAAYSSHALYGLVPAAAAFTWMAATSALTAVTADREQSQGLALIAIVLGYAAPFLVASGADHHVVLFVYDATIVGATYMLARRHRWPLLTLVSFLLAWTVFAVWASGAYRSSMFVSTEIYLTVIAALFLATLREHPRADDPLGRLTILALWLGPVAYHIASVAVLYQHSVPFLVYLIIVTAAGVAWATSTASAPARLVLWCMVAAPFYSWLAVHSAGRWYVAVIATAGALYLLHLSGQFRAADNDEPTSSADIVLFHLNGLGLFAFIYSAVYANAGSTATVAFLLAVWNLTLAVVFQTRKPDAVPHALALTFSFVAVGIGIALTGPWWTVAWAAEGAAVIWIGLATRRDWLRNGGALLLLLAAGRLIALEFGATATSFTLLFNRRAATGAFVAAMMYGAAALHRRRAAGDDRQWATGWVMCANLLTVGLITADIHSYWSLHEGRRTQGFAYELSISLAWATYAMGLIAVGFRRQAAALRYLALILFGITVAKMFAVDLLKLEGIFRISGFVAMGLILLAASFLYQRYQLHQPR